MYYSVYVKSLQLSSYQPVGVLQWGCALQNFTVWVSCYAAEPGEAESDSWRLQHDSVRGRRGVEGVWLSVLGRGGSLHPVPEASTWSLLNGRSNSAHVRQNYYLIYVTRMFCFRSHCLSVDVGVLSISSA